VVLLAASVALVIMAPMLPGKLATFAPLFLAFASGMAAWRLRDFVRLNPVFLIVSLGAAVLAKGTPAGEILATFAFCHAVLLAAYRTPALELKEDISYGVYIYGWPVAQTLVTLLPGVTPFELATLSIVCTLPIARASWSLIERPALPLRSKVA
jgi:peptidoglycan/LPS O-acetylase OafA/YrhL